MKTILVTGSNGFLGTNLCLKLLSEGNKVIGLSRSETNKINHINFKFIKSDIRETIPYLECDEIYHFAGVASTSEISEHPLDVADTIVTGTINILRLAKIYNSKFLFASSMGVDHMGDVTAGRSCYDDTKRGMEAYVFHFANTHGFEAKAIRIPSIYGPHMKIKESRVVSDFIKDVIKNGKLKIWDVDKLRPYCFVDDFISDTINIMSTNDKYINYIPSSFEISVKTLATLIQEAVLYNKDTMRGILETIRDIRERL